MGPTTVRIASHTTSGREHEVRMLNDRAIGCSCESRRIRPVVPCEHMRAADAPAEVARLTAAAQAAINKRLGYAAPTALRSITRTGDGGFVIVLGSGGNAIAVEAALRRLGYGVRRDAKACSVHVDWW